MELGGIHRIIARARQRKAVLGSGLVHISSIVRQTEHLSRELGSRVEMATYHQYCSVIHKRINRCSSCLQYMGTYTHCAYCTFLASTSQGRGAALGSGIPAALSLSLRARPSAQAA